MMNFKITSQPDDESCGPTCLHAVYNYYGYESSREEIIKTIERSPSGGTFCITLGTHALKNGFKCSIYINSLVIFDPSWFKNGIADNKLLIDKLEAQSKVKNVPYIKDATIAIVNYLKLGGKICAFPLNAKLIKSFSDKNLPVITGLSSTNLYWSTRETFTEDGRSVYDDLRGTPCGHFVIICGYNSKTKMVKIADPYGANPSFSQNNYEVNVDRLINAILLGITTYDGNLTIIEPK